MNSLRVALLFLLTQLPAPPPLQRTGTASLEGIVVRLGTNEPIAGVDLELTDTSPPEATAGQLPSPGLFTAKSGNDGRFIFRNVPSGAYKLVAARIGGAFVPFEYGQRGILGRGVVFPIGDGESKRDIRMEMAPVGTITGQVFDENRRPVGHAAVFALNLTYRDGQEYLNVAEIVHTNDHGEYRLFSLVPGKYYVAVRPEDPGRRTAVVTMVPPGRRGPYEQAVTPVVAKRILPTGETVEETYRFVYYGGSTEIRRTTPLNVTPGAVLGAIDIPLAAGKMRALHIRGKVIDGSVGGPARGANVRLIPRSFSAHMIVPQTITDGNGEFDLQGVVAGSYELYFLGAQVQQRAATPGVPPPPPPPPLTAMIPLEVGNDDVSNLSVSINVGSTVSGRVSVEGTPLSTETLARVRVVLEPVPTGVVMVQTVGAQSITADGGFKIENIWPAKYRVLVNDAPRNTYVKSIRLGSEDLLSQTQVFPMQSDASIEVVLGTDSATVNGRVANERGDGVSNVRIALVPDAPYRTRFDLYRSAYSDSYGNFRLVNVPPGDYKAFAWEEVEEGSWTNADFLRTDESRGKAVRVGPGRGESVSLTAIKR